MRLKSKDIVVTAAAQGIGCAVAKAFASEGANVIATDVNLEKLKELNNEYPDFQDEHSEIEKPKIIENNIIDYKVLFYVLLRTPFHESHLVQPANLRLRK